MDYNVSKVQLPDALSGDDERGAEFGVGAFQVGHLNLVGLTGATSHKNGPGRFGHQKPDKLLGEPGRNAPHSEGLRNATFLMFSISYESKR
jgi:hypothetical protein